jgi:hypothetical protein
MDIKLTPLYPLWSMTKVEATGTLNMNWDESYESVKVKRQSYRYPRASGSGQKIQPIKLIARNKLPEPIAALDDGRKGHVYVLLSTTYPILYVGISQGTLRTGVFGAGRLGHHIRKLFACHSAQTSHTHGWPYHAINRYRDRVAAYQAALGAMPKSSNHYSTLVGGDLLVAFVETCEKWDPANYEGTVLDALHKYLISKEIDLQILNTGVVKKNPATVCLPSNIADVSVDLLSFLSMTITQQIKILRENEVPLDINNFSNYCYDGNLVKVNNIIHCISGSFQKLWDDQWYGRILEMASEWDNIESACLAAINVAQDGGFLNNKLKSQLHEVFRIYESSTRIMLMDGEDGYEWKLKPINELKKFLNN